MVLGVRRREGGRREVIVKHIGLALLRIKMSNEDRNSQKKWTHVQAGGIWESVYIPLDFAVNLKLL